MPRYRVDSKSMLWPMFDQFEFFNLSSQHISFFRHPSDASLDGSSDCSLNGARPDNAIVAQTHGNPLFATFSRSQTSISLSGNSFLGKMNRTEQNANYIIMQIEAAFNIENVPMDTMCRCA